MLSKTRSRYVGELASPIIAPSSLSFSGAVTDKRVNEFWKQHARQERKIERAVHKKFAEKILLLFDNYGLDPKGGLKALVLALATEHVPGFQITVPKKTRRGRKREWDFQRLADLLAAVRSIKEQHPRFTDKQALSHLVSRSQHRAHWGRSANRKGSQKQWIETLESRLHDAKRWEKSLQSAEESLQKAEESVRQKHFRKLKKEF
jgi:hypothetical protein